MRGNFLRGGFPDIGVFGVEVANIKIEVSLFACKVKASNTTRVDDLPARVGVESAKERVVDDYAETARFFWGGVVVRPESGGGVNLVVKSRNLCCR